jgi:predicted dehydrogenase
MTRPVVNVGIIGGGLMGKEVAAALGRWQALTNVPVTAKLTAVCDVNPAALAWFDRVESVRHKTADYRELLADPDVDVVYIAVRHDLHEHMYVDAVAAGKDFLAEKPFGIDLASAQRIVDAISASEVFVRCSSEMPFFPGVQAIVNRVRRGDLGTIIEASNSFCHSSDLDLGKPINWKRQREFCGDAGVMNDLGLHAAHVPLRLGWAPCSVYGVLQDLVPTRPGPTGSPVPCDTIENATLLCTVDDGRQPFPLMISTKRIDPGQKNTWSLRVAGMESSAEFSTRYPKTLWIQETRGGEQLWSQVEMGSQSVFPTVTGGIFEFGFSDAILQMWAAFLTERAGELGDRFGCATPDEALSAHKIFAAAMQSAADGRATSPDIKLSR